MPWTMVWVVCRSRAHLFYISGGSLRNYWHLFCSCLPPSGRFPALPVSVARACPGTSINKPEYGDDQTSQTRQVLLKLLECLTRLRHEAPAACQLCIADLEGATVAFDHADCGLDKRLWNTATAHPTEPLFVSPSAP